MTGPTFTRSVASPSVTVVAPLKLERIRSAKFSIHKESFICLQQIYRTARVYQYPVHIKTINIEGEHQCIIVGHNDFVRVDRRKGYGTIHLLGFFMATFFVDSIYPSLNCGCSQELLLLALRLILVVRRAA